MSIAAQVSLTAVGAASTPPAVDVVAAEAAVADLLRALGRDLDDANLDDTPRRVVASLQELTSSKPFAMTTFPNEDGYDDIVLVRDIPFVSLCAHHLLPFRGVAHVGYLPGPRIVGLSKLARVVELFAHDLQVQETLTTQIADHLDACLEPRGVGVVLEAEHMCMSLRGAHSTGATTVTRAFRGAIRDDENLRAQFAPRSH
ncbi:GTP cyclohydrolase I [Microbacterium terrisoli]|uniref:GTP cyclohydrolase I n=1 Tax=Microbacterium terrisoli TaxID=3242192 RepID=UPI002803A178|nr:GTP cyclohydrolase I [Microbacterium protaetiae]